MDEKMDRNTQSISIFETSPINPVRDFTAIISNEVPTAIFMGSLESTTKAGIIKNPPPAPTKPVSVPTINPSKMMRG